MMSKIDRAKEEIGFLKNIFSGCIPVFLSCFVASAVSERNEILLSAVALLSFAVAVVVGFMAWRKARELEDL